MSRQIQNEAPPSILFANFCHDQFLSDVSDYMNKKYIVLHAGYSWHNLMTKNASPLFIDYSIIDNPVTIKAINPSLLSWKISKPQREIQAQYLGSFLSLIDRVTIGRFNSVINNSYYSAMLAYLRNRLLQKRINLVVFDSTPHMPTDIALAVAAKQLGIQIIFAVPTNIPDAVAFRTDIFQEELCNFKNSGRDSEKLFDLDSESSLLSKSKEDNFGSTGPKWEYNYKKFFFKVKFIWHRHFYNIRDSIEVVFNHKWNDHYFRMSRGMSLFYVLQQWHQDVKNRKFLRQKSKAPSMSPLGQEYVYFPLQFQPERTTFPESHFFSDQIAGILAVRQFIPEKIPILVKEHPRQLRFRNSDIRRLKFRSREFYENILNIPNVQLVPYWADTRNLIENAKLVISSTGSSLWEGLLLGKPGISLAPNWHSTFEWSPYLLDIEDPGQYFREALKIRRFEVIEALGLYVKKIAQSLVVTVDCEHAAKNAHHLREDLIVNYVAALEEFI